MILVLTGTRDGRELVASLVARGYKVLASTATTYGGELLQGYGAEVKTGRMGDLELAELLKEKGIRLVVDATHPYAEVVSQTAGEVCRKAGVSYLRYQRPQQALPSHPLIFLAEDYIQAARAAVNKAGAGGLIFLATGSKTLDIFIQAAREKDCRVAARVLPDPDVMIRCRELGLTPADIVAMQGPFSRELNRSLFRHYNAAVLVTKESGQVGGTDDKVAAALELGMQVVVVRRPPAPNGAIHSVAETVTAVDRIMGKGC